jgi:citrate synthase
LSASHGEGARIVWPTAITAVEPDLLYRGYRVEELAERASFLETAYLLVTGELPISEQWADWQALMLGGMTLSDNIAGWLTRVPAAATPLDVLSGAFTRTRLSEGPPPPATTQDIRDGLPQWLGFVTAVVAGRIRWTRGLAPLAPRDDLSFAGNLWWLIHGREPAAYIERALDMLLVLGADHGLAPATIAVRLAAAAGADFPAALQAGTSLAMSRHPVGVAEASLDLLHDVKTPARAKAWVEQQLEQHAGLPGFEHRIYRVGDPRTDVTAALCKRVAERAGRKEREELATAIEQAVWEQQQRLPSVIWPAARLLDYLGVDRPLFGPLYVIARMAGWAAHYVEQRETSGWPQTASPYHGPGPRQYQPEHERA